MYSKEAKKERKQGAKRKRSSIKTLMKLRGQEGFISEKEQRSCRCQESRIRARHSLSNQKHGQTPGAGKEGGKDRQRESRNGGENQRGLLRGMQPRVTAYPSAKKNLGNVARNNQLRGKGKKNVVIPGSFKTGLWSGKGRRGSID